jgi:histone H3/H4
MSPINYETSLTDYRRALAGLYGTSVGALRERGEGDIVAAPDLEERASVVVQRSFDLGQAAGANLASVDSGQRELAQLQLLAAAALDLHVASDLARRAEEGPGLEIAERSTAIPQAIMELNAILDADPLKGITGLVGGLVERGGPAESQSAREALMQAIEFTLEDIQEGAAKLGQATFSNLMQLPVPPLKDAASVVLAELFEKVGQDVSRLLSKAVALIAQAIDKLVQALGKDTEEAARKKVTEWIEDLQAGTLFVALVKRLYETERIRTELVEVLEGLPEDLPAERYNQATVRVNELAAIYAKQNKTIDWLRHGLAWARPWIMSLAPWGPLGLTAGYVLTIGYVVYSGGDYLDWYRTGEEAWLDRVAGLRTTVDQIMGSHPDS